MQSVRSFLTGSVYDVFDMSQQISGTSWFALKKEIDFGLQFIREESLISKGWKILLTGPPVGKIEQNFECNVFN